MVDSITREFMSTDGDEPDGANLDFAPHDANQATMQSQLDFGSFGQDSSDLMFQTLPHEVSEPVICKLSPP